MIKILPPKLFYCQNPIFATDKIYVMESKSLFEKAVADSNSLNTKPSNETLLQLYSLYKQATKGDVNIDPPENPFDFVAKAKYEAWAALKGTSIKDAQNESTWLIN
jgi:acyl-CoA-binding protein